MATPFAIDIASDGMFSLDGEGRIRSWNSGARRIFKYTRHEIVGKSISVLLPPTNRRRMTRVLATLRAHSWIDYGEARCFRKGAIPVEVAFTVIPEQALTSHRDGCILIVHDISVRKETERQLKSLLRQHEEAAKLAGLGSWEWDVGNDTLVWSEEFYRLLGLDRSLRQSTLKRFLRRIRKEDRRGFVAAIRKTLRERIPFECRFGLRRDDGAILEVVSRGRLIRGPGTRERLVGTTQELHALPDERSPVLRTYARRAKSLHLHHLVLARASAILFSTFDREQALLKTAKAVVPALADRCIVDLADPDGTALRLKAMTVDSTGQGRQPGLVQQERLETFPAGAPTRVRSTGEFEVYRRTTPEVLASLFPNLEALSLPPGVAPSSILLVPLRSRHEVIGTLTLVQWESRRGFTTQELLTAQRLAHLMSLALEHCRLYSEVVREAKELRTKEQAILGANRHLDNEVRIRTTALRQALSDMEGFARTVAHDLRAPLRGVSGLAQILAEDVGDRLGAEASHLTARIQEGCLRMENLIRDLLAYSRASQVEAALEPVDIAQIVETARRQLEPELIRRGARITIESPLPRVMAHPGLLLPTLVNLLENASKFVAPGVSPSIRVGAERRGERVRLTIEDNGIGIPPDYADRLFQPFERLHSSESYPGTGLGLAIVRRSIERMGGTVGLDSPATGGSRFWIELPRAPNPSTAATTS